MNAPLRDPAPAPSLRAFRQVPRTGVIYVTSEAVKRGYKTGHPDWCNLGQGMPEIGPLPGAPPRAEAVAIDPGDHEYAPISGIRELREAVASMYNRLFRQGKKSQYTWENVSISGGGRAALTRVAAALGHVNLGHFLPDYTAYEELLDIFKLVTPMPILLSRRKSFDFSAGELRREMVGRGLGAVLLSNPNNPMGKVIAGDELAAWVRTARRQDCALLIDEFYSHYVWDLEDGEPGPVVSAARYVDDVDRDPVVILDGLTKNWRYPGWRVTWTVGPRQVIQAVESAGSFLDGGGSKPLQRAAIPLLEPEHVLAETAAIRAAFLKKRTLLMETLPQLGLGLDRAPAGTFYAFVSTQKLPAKLRDGVAFFEAALEHKVICVPGFFFDVNPGRRREGAHSRFHQRVRLSFGPGYDEVSRGLERLRTMIEAAKKR